MTTVAEMIFRYGGIQYLYSQTFKETPGGAVYSFFTEGAGSGDFNRSRLIRKAFGDAIPELKKGNKIKIENLHIIEKYP